MSLRRGFLEIIGSWSLSQDIDDIPRRIKKMDTWMEQNKLKELDEITDEEAIIRAFMLDVQATREKVRRINAASKGTLVS